MLETIRRWLRALLEATDWRSLHPLNPFKLVLYISFFVGGATALICKDAALTAVHPDVSELAFNVWMWLNICCPLMTFTGIVLCESGVSTGDDLPHKRITNGYLLRFGGDVGMMFALIAYIVTLMPDSAYHGTVISGVATCMALLALGNFRQLRRQTQWKKQRER